jgi:hypothetical protein
MSSFNKSAYSSGLLESSSFVEEVKQRIQLTFQNVYITTEAKRRKFFDRSAELPGVKIILNGVSGTILPG